MPDSSPTQITHLQIKLKLLDDLHTGSGLGNHIIDSLQARDPHGLPIITAQHFKGLFKQALEALPETNCTKDERKVLDTLLNSGQGEAQRSELVFESLRFSERNPSQSPYIVWTSTARGKLDENRKAENGKPYTDKLSRTALQDTLRKVEYVRAGADFSGGIYLISPEQSATTQHQQQLELVQRVLKRISHFGGNRNRGAGGITLSVTAQQLQQPPHITAPENAAKDNHTLYLTFTNPEPLRLPATQVPGNLIPSENHISSGKLRGALANWCRLLGQQALFEALIETNPADYEVAVSNAYPSCNGQKTVPWPHSLQLSKPEPQGDALPWWCYSKHKQIKDTFNCSTKQREGKSFKRNKQPLFIYQQEQQWHSHQQAKSIQMRNAVRTDRNNDNSALFSEEVLSPDSQFCAELSASNPGQAAQLHRLLSWAAEHEVPFLLGRGKAPCIIRRVSTEQAQPQIGQGENLTLVLESDWLVYQPDTLAPYESLSMALLDQLFDLELEQESGQLTSNWQSRSELTQLTGFNFASGLPKKPTTALAAGSSIQLSDPKVINKLLAAMPHHPSVGERTKQGLGRYWYYRGELQLSPASESQHTPENNLMEQQHSEVKQLLGNKTCAGSVQQWQRLASMVTRYQHRHRQDKEELDSKQDENQSNHSPKALAKELDRLFLGTNKKTQAVDEFLKKDSKQLISQWSTHLKHSNDFQLSHLLLDAVIAQVAAQANKGGQGDAE